MFFLITDLFTYFIINKGGDNDNIDLFSPLNYNID